MQSPTRPFTHLLVPVDGGALASRAIATGVDFACKVGAAVTVLVAEPPGEAQETGHGLWHHLESAEAHRHRAEQKAGDLLAAFEQRALAAGIGFEGLYLPTTDLDLAVDALAQARGCDMIVMATGGFGQAWTRRVMARSRLPVLVVH